MVEKPSAEGRELAYAAIVVGAGPVGAALALALSRAQPELRIALVEAQAPALSRDAVIQTTPFDHRVLAITPANRDWLDALGVWPALARPAPYRHMHVWDYSGSGAIDFDAAEVGAETLGWIVETGQLTTALHRVLQQQANVHWHCPASVVEYVQGEATDPGETRPGAGPVATLGLADGTRLQAPVVAAADGARSLLRELAGMATRSWPYHQRAVVTTVRCEQPHQRTAWQVFLPTGPLAFLPLRNVDGDEHHCAIVWSLDEDAAEAVLALDDADFCARLARAFEHRLGAITWADRRLSYPLIQCHAVDYVRGPLTLVGDAAHSIHPLAGQGVNLGLADARELTAQLHQGRQRGEPWAHPRRLRAYQRARQGENLAMMAAMEGFKRLFGNDQPGLTWLRNWGLKQVNGLPALKRLLIRQAMGR